MISWLIHDQLHIIVSLSLPPWATSQQHIRPVTTSICSIAGFASDAVLIHFLFLLEVIGLGPHWPPSHHTLEFFASFQRLAISSLISSQNYVYGEAVEGTWFHLLIHQCKQAKKHTVFLSKDSRYYNIGMFTRAITNDSHNAELTEHHHFDWGSRWWTNITQRQQAINPWHQHN